MKKMIITLLCLAQVFTVFIGSANAQTVSAKTMSFDTFLCDGESTANITTAFQTTVSCDTTHTQGAYSLKMDYTNPVGQNNNVGGMVFIKFSNPLDLSSYTTATFDLYLANALPSASQLQINFATEGEDGYNWITALNGVNAGWHNYTIDLSAIPPAVSSADWTKINCLRVTWINIGQMSSTYFLLDNFKVSESHDMNEIAVNDNSFTTFGRTYYKNNALCFNWTNSGFHFAFTGTAAAAKLTASNSVSSGVFLNIYIDDTFNRTIKLANGTADVLLTSGLENGRHTVRVVKRSENVWGGTATLNNLYIDGTIGTTPENSIRRIEVIGDSITCGFGNMVVPSTALGGYHSSEEDGTATYAVRAANYFDADISVVARSGIGFSCDSAGNKELLMSHVYEYTDYLTEGASSAKWDFSSNKNDVVILALGTNDTANGDNNDYIVKAREMLAMVRRNNPDSYIIWAYGMMTNSRENVLQDIVAEAKNAGDNKVYYLPLTIMNNTVDGVGGGGHPGMASHIENSKKLAILISEITGWKPTKELDKGIITEQSLMLYDGESTSNVSSAFGTNLSLNSTRTEGSNSLKMDYTVAKEQLNNIGGMTFITFDSSIDLSFYDTAKLDIYFPNNLSGSQGLQINFATVGEDGYNYMHAIETYKAGWNTISINLSSISAATANADWTKINKIRITWMNYIQADPTYFLLDNFKAVKTSSTSQPMETAPIAKPFNRWTEGTQAIFHLGIKGATNQTANFEHFRFLAQEFVPSTNAINGVKLSLNLTSGAAVLHAEIRSKLDNEPLTSKNVIIKSKGNNNSWYSVYFDQAVTVIPAQTYYIVYHLNALSDGSTCVAYGSDLGANNANNPAHFWKMSDGGDPVYSSDQNQCVLGFEVMTDEGANEHLFGDCDQNGSITSNDALMTLQNAVEIIDFSAENDIICDTNGDKSISSVDALLILQRAVDKLDKFPVE